MKICGKNYFKIKKNREKYLNSIIIPIIVSIISVLIITLSGFIFDFLYYKNQNSINVYFIKREQYKNFIPMNNGDFNDNSFLIAIKNKNKYNNIVLSSIRIKLDLKIIPLIFISNNLEKSYYEEMSAFYAIKKSFYSIENIDKRPNIEYLKEIYNENIFTFYEDKIKNYFELNDNKNKFDKLFIFYSNKKNYKKRGEIINSLVDIIKPDIDINYAYLLEEFPIEIKYNETKIVKIPSIIIKLALSLSQDKKLHLCFAEDCESIIVPENETNSLLSGEFFYNTKKSNMPKTTINFNEIIDDYYDKVGKKNYNINLMYSYFNSDINEIDINLRNQYFGKFTANQYKEYFDISAFILNKYKKSSKSFKIKNKQKETEIIKYTLSQIEKSFNKFPPNIELDYLKNNEFKLLKFMSDQGNIDCCKEIISNIDEFIALISSKGNIGVMVSKYPELNNIYRKYEHDK